jgi:hypothetical protein
VVRRPAAAAACAAPHWSSGSATQGALGVITSLVPPPGPQGWGTSKISTTVSETIPEIGLGCEDYGLVYRLAERNQSPMLRVDAQSSLRGEVPAANVIAELRGREKPNEYVMLSAHLDSWDPASGATDNGSGTVVMMEAMRILKAVYPNPKRTILAGHWNGEEQGFNGSGSFATDHPQVVAGLQALLNQDSGTGPHRAHLDGGIHRRGRVLPPLAVADARRRRARHPAHRSGPAWSGVGQRLLRVSRGAGFNLLSRSWDYVNYTWHTNRDTFDKLVFDDLQQNAMLVAMLAYQASEDPERVPRREERGADGCASDAAVVQAAGTELGGERVDDHVRSLGRHASASQIVAAVPSGERGSTSVTSRANRRCRFSSSGSAARAAAAMSSHVVMPLGFVYGRSRP